MSQEMLLPTHPDNGGVPMKNPMQPMIQDEAINLRVSNANNNQGIAQDDLQKNYRAKCFACSQGVTSNDWVQKVHNHIFHLTCFTCKECNKQIATGEEFALHDDRLLCKSHYLEAVGNDGASSEDDADSSGELQKSANQPKSSAKSVQDKKSNRTVFSDEQLRVLHTAFKENPMPKNEELDKIATSIGLNKRTCRIWYQNSRAKMKKIIQQQHMRNKIAMNKTNDDAASSGEKACATNSPTGHSQNSNTGGAFPEDRLPPNTTTQFSETQRDLKQNQYLENSNDTASTFDGKKFHYSESLDGSSSMSEDKKPINFEPLNYYMNASNNTNAFNGNGSFAEKTHEVPAQSFVPPPNFGMFGSGNSGIMPAGFNGNLPVSAPESSNSEINDEPEPEVPKAVVPKPQKQRTGSDRRKSAKPRKSEDATMPKPKKPSKVSERLSSTPVKSFVETATLADYESKTGKRSTRTIFTREQLEVLKTHFKQTQSPKGQELIQISETVGLSRHITRVWFQNARAKIKRLVERGKMNETEALNSLSSGHELHDSSMDGEKHDSSMDSLKLEIDEKQETSMDDSAQEDGAAMTGATGDYRHTVQSANINLGCYAWLKKISIQNMLAAKCMSYAKGGRASTLKDPVDPVSIETAMLIS